MFALWLSEMIFELKRVNWQTSHIFAKCKIWKLRQVILWVSN